MCLPQQPSLRELGLDLLHLSRRRKALVVITPLLCAGAYVAFALAGIWPLAVLALMGLSFFSYGSTSHDLLHRNLRLPRWMNEFLLSAIELLALRSGHAYRAAHLHHHARFPHDDDIEGAAARKSFLGAIFDGLTLQSRIWFWALRKDIRSRGWIFAEGLLCVGLAFLSVLFISEIPMLFVYVVLMLLGHALLPLFTVYLVHDPEGACELFQTRAFRGRIASLIALEHLYHLEHHLFPSVPHPNWPELARRLEPFLVEAGVRFHRIGLRPVSREPQASAAATPRSPEARG